MRPARGTWAIAVVLAIGCGSATVGQGGVRQACYSNQTCNTGLTCASGICVSLDTGATGGNSGSGGSAGGSGGKLGTGGLGTGGSNTGGATGGAAGAVSHTGGTGGTAGATGGTGGMAGSAGGAAGGAGGGGIGGHAGNGGAAGNSGGTGGSATATCAAGLTTAPSTMLITDFSDAMPSSNGNYGFGSTTGQPGGTYIYTASTNATLSIAGGALTFQATVPAPTTANMYPFSGFGLALNGPACLNAAAYTGVSFSLFGSGTCNVVFSFEDKEHTSTSDDAQRGTCTGTCYAGQYAITVSATPTTVKMPFSAGQKSAGNPATPVDTMNLTGFAWQLGQAVTATSTCTETITIGSVTFY